jgi:hypothetical protein
MTTWHRFSLVKDNNRIANDVLVLPNDELPGEEQEDRASTFRSL